MRNMFQKNLLVIKKLWARSSHDPRMSTDGLDAVQNELKFFLIQRWNIPRNGLSSTIVFS